MKVNEKGTDRVADAHICVEGRVQPLKEYGQYIDAHDKAICCYVPVDAGDKLKFKGNFSGTTIVVAYDALVDAVCRKAHFYAGKSVQVQKNKKLEFDTFLYQTLEGVIDTKMSVSPYSGSTKLDKGAEARETIGTLELRVYITRQFGSEHSPSDTRRFDSKGGLSAAAPVALYKDMEPHFQMKFEENCSILEGSKATLQKSKISKKHPGTEPWAIFRFHYRSEAAILKKNMELTWDPANKAHAKKEAHPLELEPVPMLQVNSKPAGKNDGETSVRTSSTPPPDAPSTPNKAAKKSQSKQPKVVVSKQQSKLLLAPLANPADTTIAETMNICSNVASAPSNAPLSTLKMQETGSKIATPTKSAPNDDLDSYSVAGLKAGGDNPGPANNTTNSIPKPSNAHATKKDTSEDSVSKTVAEKDKDLANYPLQTLDRKPTDEPEPKVSVDITRVSNFVTVPEHTTAQAQIHPQSKDVVKNSTNRFTSPMKKAQAKPAAIDTTVVIAPNEPTVPSAPATPMKRAPEDTLTPPPDSKRIKFDTPLLTPSRLSHSASASPGPRPLSPSQVTEKRKQLDDMQFKRAELARKKADVDKRLAPHKQRIAAELEELNRQLAEEEAMMAMEEQEYRASEEMLAELEGGHGGF